MIRAKIPIQRTPDGSWKVGPSSVQIDSERRIALSSVAREESLDDLVETMMGQALLSLDKNGRRGTSEPIQWEITVDQVPYCYRCVQPMERIARQPDVSADSDHTEWKCAACGTVMQVQ
jgi:hypothetical protein